MADERDRQAGDKGTAGCCPLYHEAVELIGKRWTGAILGVLMISDRDPAGPKASRAMRFSEIAQAVPELSDRLLSRRMKELEARGLIVRTVSAGPPVRVEYSLTQMGRELGPALSHLETWARRWLREDEPAPSPAADLIAAGTR